MADQKQLTITLPELDHRALKALAAIEGASMTGIVREALASKITPSFRAPSDNKLKKSK